MTTRDPLRFWRRLASRIDSSDQSKRKGITGANGHRFCRRRTRSLRKAALPNYVSVGQENVVIGAVPLLDDMKSHRGRLRQPCIGSSPASGPSEGMRPQRVRACCVGRDCLTTAMHMCSYEYDAILKSPCMSTHTMRMKETGRVQTHALRSGDGTSHASFYTSTHVVSMSTPEQDDDVSYLASSPRSPEREIR